MKKLTLSALLLSCIMMAFAQKTDQTKTIKQFYTEMGGPSVLFSANFDTRFKPGVQTGLGMRAGLGFLIQDNFYVEPNIYGGVRTVANLPIGLNYIMGKENSPNYLEVGAGTTILFKKANVLTYYSNDKAGNLLGYFQFMYRRQPVNGGFAWRIGFTPIINTGGDIFPFGAVGIGYSFK